MYPVLIEFGSIKIPSWHVFYMLGAIAAYLYLIVIWRKQLAAFDERILSRLFAACYISGYFGARFLSILIEQEVLWRHHPSKIVLELFNLGPMTFYGGFISAIFTGYLYSKSVDLSTLDVADAAIPAGLLALGIGRIGCFLNGDDYGKAVPLQADSRTPWWSVIFPNLEDGISRYPVQLMEAMSVMLIVTIATLLFKSLRSTFRAGAVALVCLVSYANVRFLLEFLRDDFRGFIFGTWLSTSQFLSLVVLITCAISFPYWIKGADISGNKSA